MTRCEARGFHVRPGDGNGTNSESILWAERCRDCGTPLGDWSFEHTAEDFAPSTVNPAGSAPPPTHGSSAAARMQTHTNPMTNPRSRGSEHVRPRLPQIREADEPMTDSS